MYHFPSFHKGSTADSSEMLQLRLPNSSSGIIWTCPWILTFPLHVTKNCMIWHWLANLSSSASANTNDTCRSHVIEFNLSYWKVENVLCAHFPVDEIFFLSCENLTRNSRESDLFLSASSHYLFSRARGKVKYLRLICGISHRFWFKWVHNLIFIVVRCCVWEKRELSSRKDREKSFRLRPLDSRLAADVQQFSSRENFPK